MSCCGQKRQHWQAPVTKTEVSKAVLKPALENLVTIVYHGYGSYLIKGQQTGYLYLFGSQEPQLQVDGRDAAFLLADTKRFSQAPMF